MNIESILTNLRVLWRTDRIIADIRMRHLLTGLGLKAFAALIAGFGLMMLELSAYFALVQVWSAISAAAILGVSRLCDRRAAVRSRIETAERAANWRSPTKSTRRRSRRCRSRPVPCSRSYRHDPASAERRLPSLIVPLITVIIRSLKKPGVTAGPHNPRRRTEIIAARRQDHTHNKETIKCKTPSPNRS